MDTLRCAQPDPPVLKRETFSVDAGMPVINDVAMGICAQVREILESDQHPFVVYPYDEDTDFGSPDYKIDRRAIMGYGGSGTFPFISDPTEECRGAVGILDDKLVYSTAGIPLHEYRDSYRYAAQCGLDHIFFINAGFIWVVSQFQQERRQIHLSTDMQDFDLHHPFSTYRQISLNEMIATSKLRDD